MTIPQPIRSETEDKEAKIWRQLTFGCRYILGQPSLLAILIFLLSSNLFSSASFAIAFTMILARSGDNAAVLASVQSALGLGGLVGAVVLSVWGGFKRRIHGLLLGFALKSLCQIFLALGRIPLAWIGAAFGAAFFFPFTGSSNQAIWLSKVEPEVQGRVFATRYLLAQITTPIGAAIAGPLADRVFEPAMRSGGTLAEMFGGVFGTGAGAGMALEYALFSSCGLAVALMGYAFPVLRDVEVRVPDRDPGAVS